MNFLGLDSARKNRLLKREEIRTAGIFGNSHTSKIDEEIMKLKQKMGKLPDSTRRLLKFQLKSLK